MMIWTPFISLFTIFLETLFLIVSLKSKRKILIKIPGLAILSLLLSYQIIEVLICSNMVSKLIFSKVAFILILWLPAIGINLIINLMDVKSKFLVYIYYVFALLLMFAVIFDKRFVTDVSCTVFWAKYANSKLSYLLYSIYYESGQLLMIFLSIYGIIISDSKVTRLSLGYILIGTIIFVLFGFVLAALVPEANGALPSLMCHFALFLSLSIMMLLKLDDANLLT